MNTQFDNPEVDIDFKKSAADGAIYELIGPPMKGKWLKEIDYNLFFNDKDAFKAIVHMRPLGSETYYYNLKEWQDIGFDMHSMYANPLFLDSDKCDFRLDEKSPAYSIGFKPFELDKYGIDENFENRYIKFS
ncbi:hypothetical protein CS063_03770 [Sporanaerobium hydrogeniformans]|uniref:Uncharacterized protein n=1 Tax=Sporanaerobium hydrogeniformans TaxID=3072179 RepID=A0AC61DFL9_9FIRM|nr:hypothetical protein [Sporanaerobium hydrogeniformans]PHV71690.1 hypothetical protein CS063_03770 [Sporanaerobium hydrogeniformans]